MLPSHFLRIVYKATWYHDRHPGLSRDVMLLGILADLVMAGHSPLSDDEWQHAEAQAARTSLAGTSTFA